MNDLYEFGIREIAHRFERKRVWHVYEVEIWRITVIFFCTPREREDEGAWLKGLFLNLSLRRLGIVALRTVEVLERWRFVRFAAVVIVINAKFTCRYYR